MSTYATALKQFSHLINNVASMSDNEQKEYLNNIDNLTKNAKNYLNKKNNKVIFTKMVNDALLQLNKQEENKNNTKISNNVETKKDETLSLIEQLNVLSQQSYNELLDKKNKEVDKKNTKETKIKLLQIMKPFVKNKINQMQQKEKKNKQEMQSKFIKEIGLLMKDPINKIEQKTKKEKNNINIMKPFVKNKINQMQQKKKNDINKFFKPLLKGSIDQMQQEKRQNITKKKNEMWIPIIQKAIAEEHKKIQDSKIQEFKNTFKTYVKLCMKNNQEKQVSSQQQQTFDNFHDLMMGFYNQSKPQQKDTQQKKVKLWGNTIKLKNNINNNRQASNNIEKTQPENTLNRNY